MLYQYIKAPIRTTRNRNPVIPIVLIAAGTTILGWVIWPIASFALVEENQYLQTLSPLPEQSEEISVRAFSPVVLAADSKTMGTSELDYTNANVWFPTAPQKRIVTPVNSYTLTIEKLHINNASVIIGGEDLTKSLIHYGGTGLPGEYGNSVVFGHSTLPQFFSPTNYKSIFSTLPTLEVGDRIYVTYDGVTYAYDIEAMTVVEATDLSPLEQRFDDSYLTLITCVPPGTYWKRLIVKSRLTRI